MQSTKPTIRRLACTAGLALTALAAVATGAGAADGSGASGRDALICNPRAPVGMPAGAYRALMIRSAALNRKYGLGV